MPIAWTADKIVEFIDVFERGHLSNLTDTEYNEAFQIMIDGGLAFQLGRKFSDEASRLIDLKRCTPPHKIFCIGCID